MNRLDRLAGQLLSPNGVDSTGQPISDSDVSMVKSLRDSPPLAKAASASRKMTLDEWKAMQGKEIGVSEYLLVSQERVDAFSLVGSVLLRCTGWPGDVLSDSFLFSDVM